MFVFCLSTVTESRLDKCWYCCSFCLVLDACKMSKSVVIAALNTKDKPAQSWPVAAAEILMGNV